MIITALIDNTIIYLGCADEATGKIIFKTSVSTSLRKTVTEYSITIRQIFQLNDVRMSDVNGGIIASVVPQITSTIKTAMINLFHINIIEVGPGVRSGLDTRIDFPTTLGADMLVGAVAAIHQFDPPMAIVTVCTDMTISVIDEKKRFVGRIISPGVKNSFDTVYETSALMGNFPIKKPDKVIGTTTEKAVQSGVIYGCAASIDGMIDRIAEELGLDHINVILSGEYGALLAPLCRKQITLDPDLMTKGLILIYNKNSKNR